MHHASPGPPWHDPPPTLVIRYKLAHCLQPSLLSAPQLGYAKPVPCYIRHLDECLDAPVLRCALL